MSHEQRFIAIETKIAYHEDIVAALNDTIVQQQHRLDALEARYTSLLERVTALGPAGVSAADGHEVPPHY